jgi:peroxiredoxin
VSAVRRAISAAALAAAILVPALAADASGRNLDGQQAPEIRLTAGLNGASAATTLASLRGKVVCLKFWLTNCPICRGTLPEFQSLHDQYGKSGVYCLGVVIDSPEGVSPYLQQARWTFPVGCDPNQASSSKYGVSHFPGDYVIGPDGVVRSSSGFPRQVIDEELRKARALEWGNVPPSLAAAREAVEDGDYGEALRKAEPLAAAAGAAADVKAAVARLVEIAKQRQDNRFARADAFVQAGNVAAAKQVLERVVSDFKGTSLEARAKERLAALK